MVVVFEKAGVKDQLSAIIELKFALVERGATIVILVPQPGMHIAVALASPTVLICMPTLLMSATLLNK